MDPNECPSSDELEAWEIELAKGGDRDAAIDLLGSAVAQLYAGTLRTGMADYLAQALQSVLEDDGGPTGDAFERAFNVKRPNKKPENPQTEARRVRIAAWVELARARGLEKAEAKARASDLWGVENIDRTMRGVTVTAQEDGTDFWEKAFLAMGKPLPPRR